MKNHLSKILFAISLLFFTGCETTKNQTREAVVFNSFATTWATAHATYGAYCELAVQGKVSAQDQKDIDAQWNRFRESFKLALRFAQNNWQATTPDDISKLKDDLIILIRAL